MRSNEGPVSGNKFQVIPSQIPSQAVDAARQDSKPGEEALRIRQVEIAQQHRDLDDTIAVLSQADTCDELLIARLKKRKLRIKDEIARIERLLPGSVDRVLP